MQDEISIYEQAQEAISEGLSTNGKPVKLAILINHASEGEAKQALVTLMVGENVERTEYVELNVQGLTDLVYHFEDVISDQHLIFPEKGMNDVEEKIWEGYNEPYDQDAMQALLDKVVFTGSEHVSAHTEVCIFANPGYSAAMEVKLCVGFIADTTERDREQLKQLQIDMEPIAKDPYKILVLTTTTTSTFPRL